MIPPDTQGYALKRGEGRSIDFHGTKMTVKMPGAQMGESYSRNARSQKGLVRRAHSKSAQAALVKRARVWKGW